MKQLHSHPALSGRQPPPPKEPDRNELPVTPPYLARVIRYPQAQPVANIPSEPVFAPQPTMMTPDALETERAEVGDVAAQVSVVIVNFQTAALIEKCLASLTKCYPTIPTIVIDNGSTDASRFVIYDYSIGHQAMTYVFNHQNIRHGLALHQGMCLAKTAYVLTLDSDTEVVKCGFIELMLAVALAEKAYAVGWTRCADRETGVSAARWTRGLEDTPRYCVYAHPAISMYHRDTYFTMPSFTDEGAPALLNMCEAKERKLVVVSFPVGKYVNHLVAGTRRLFAGKWDPTPDAQPGKWSAKQQYPI